MPQLKDLLDGQFSTLESFRQDSRYRVPHDDHAHAVKVSLRCLRCCCCAPLLLQPLCILASGAQKLFGGAPLLTKHAWPLMSLRVGSLLNIAVLSACTMCSCL